MRHLFQRPASGLTGTQQVGLGLLWLGTWLISGDWAARALLGWPSPLHAADHLLRHPWWHGALVTLLLWSVSLYATVRRWQRPQVLRGLQWLCFLAAIGSIVAYSPPLGLALSAAAAQLGKLWRTCRRDGQI